MLACSVHIIRLNIFFSISVGSVCCSCMLLARHAARGAAGVYLESFNVYFFSFCSVISASRSEICGSKLQESFGEHWLRTSLC